MPLLNKLPRDYKFTLGDCMTNKLLDLLDGGAHARIFGRQLPVDGRIILRYDLYDVGEPFNITQPFGC